MAGPTTGGVAPGDVTVQTLLMVRPFQPRLIDILPFLCFGRAQVAFPAGWILPRRTGMVTLGTSLTHFAHLRMVLVSEQHRAIKPGKLAQDHHLGIVNRRMYT